MISACCLFQHFKKSFNYSSVLQTEYNEKQNKNRLHPILLGSKRDGDLGCSKWSLYSSKIISHIQPNYLSKKVAEWSPNDFLSIILSEPLIIKFRENFEWDLKIFIGKNFIFKKRNAKFQCVKKIFHGHYYVSQL